MDLTPKSKNSWLGWFLRGLVVLVFFVIVARLTELQVIKGGYYTSLADENRIRRVTIWAPRGRILARDGQVIADNVEIKKRVIFNPEQGYEKSTDLTDAQPHEILKESQRVYKYDEPIGHITGYVGEADRESVGMVNKKCPVKGEVKLGATIGKGGLEAFFECNLSGVDGEELVEVDTMGRKIRTLGRREPKPGQDLTTTIDILLQEKITEIMKDKLGAVVALTPDGEVLAIHSSPSFSPNTFVNNDDEKITELLEDSKLPLFNRAIGGAYHPGSVFKPVVSLAALEEGAIDTDYRYTDTGIIEVNGFSYTNWYFTQYGGTEGEIGLARALARSTDTFYYKIGELTGIDKLVDWTKQFGFGTPTGVELAGEVAGLVPNPEWKEDYKAEKWFLGNTYHFSIGQGDLATTPLQVASSIAAIANDGSLCTPRINKESDKECIDLGIADKHLDLVKQGMIEACNDGGTGYTFFGFEPQVACKTGTAETGVDEDTHAWFVVFAPVENPEIVLTVLMERGGEGSSVAGPIARDIFNYWFGKSGYGNPDLQTATPSSTPLSE